MTEDYEDIAFVPTDFETIHRMDPAYIDARRKHRNPCKTGKSGG
jgi:hypothetical protein